MIAKYGVMWRNMAWCAARASLEYRKDPQIKLYLIASNCLQLSSSLKNPLLLGLLADCWWFSFYGSAVNNNSYAYLIHYYSITYAWNFQNLLEGSASRDWSAPTSRHSFRGETCRVRTCLSIAPCSSHPFTRQSEFRVQISVGSAVSSDGDCFYVSSRPAETRFDTHFGVCNRRLSGRATQ